MKKFYELDVCSSVGSNTSYTNYQGSTSFMCYILVVRTSCV